MVRKSDFTKREIVGPYLKAKKLLVLMGAILVLTIIGPFGTYDDLSLVNRFVYWALVINGVGMFMATLIPALLARAQFATFHPIIIVIIGTAFAAIPGALIVHVVEEILRPQYSGLNHIYSIWLQVWVIGAVICSVEFIQWRHTAADPDIESDQSEYSSSPAKTNINPIFLRRIPSQLGTDLISLSMKDHYVEVVTTKGKELVLLRLSDAVNELGIDSGIQIHRSHWVSKNHVEKVTKNNGRVSLKLSDGRKLPVSLTYIDQVTQLFGQPGSKARYN